MRSEQIAESEQQSEMSINQTHMETTEYIRANEDQRGQQYYGCLFCVTGREEDIAERIQDRTNIKALAPIKLRYHRKKGGFSVRTARIFPGYVFFTTDRSDFSVETLETIDGVIRLLKYDNQDWSLKGSDAETVAELFNYGGVVGFSKGSFIDGRLRIRQGFLKRYEDEIFSVDRRHRAAKIRMRLNNQLMEMWFGYEIDDDEWQTTADSPNH